MKITVVIPAYNESEYLPNCLRSLAHQSRPADEIIVVDNNSSDDTVRIAESFGATVLSEPQQGIWSASQRGYDKASGDIIARCDADSILPPDWLERIEQHYTQPHASDAITGPGVFYGAPRVVCQIANLFYMHMYFLSVGAALGGYPLFGSNFAMKRSTWRSVRETIHPREDIHDDIDLSYHLSRGSIRLNRALAVQISTRPLFTYRGMIQRYAKGFRSIYIHWPEQAPWRIYAKRIREKIRSK